MNATSEGARTSEPATSRHAALDSLMRAAQDGDRHAYHALLQEVALRMRRLITARAPWLGQADVEDIVQDVLLSLHMARATWDPERPFMPWITAIARNRLTDHARRYKRKQAFDAAASDLAEVFSTKTSRCHASGVVDLISVRHAMSDLSPGERRAFELVRMREMSLSEAAAKEDSTVGAIKVAVHRASRKLKQAINRDGEEDR